MYYIYHIPGVKIGCTKNLRRRVELEQKSKNYEILEEHEDVDVASMRERELQQEYGYVIDHMDYRKISQIHTYRTEESFKKLSEKLKGKPATCFGHTEETRKKLSEKLKGRQFTEEWRKKISDTRKELKLSQGPSNGRYGKGAKIIEVTTGFCGYASDIEKKFNTTNVMHFARRGEVIKVGKLKGLQFKIYEEPKKNSLHI